MNKKLWFYTIILLTTISLGSAYALFFAQKITPQPTRVSTSTQPDFFMTTASYTDFNQEGEIHSQIATAKITHFANNDSYFFENPYLLIFSPDQMPWIITAKNGKSEHGKEKVYLWDNVLLHQDASKKNSETTITTTALTVYPLSKTATTDKPITINQGGSIMTATGASADFKVSKVSLLSKVVGKYQNN